MLRDTIQRLDEAMACAISTARDLRGKLLAEAKLTEAEKHNQAMAVAEAAAEDAAEKHALRVGPFLIDSMLPRRRIHTLLEGDTIIDFDHYLQLCAARKLLPSAEKQLETRRASGHEQKPCSSAGLAPLAFAVFHAGVQSACDA